MKKTLLVITLILGFVSISQEEADDHADHDHYSNVIGVAMSPVYFVKEKELSFGPNLHYVYNFPQTKWGSTLGYEHVFDDHKHNVFGVVASYRPVDGWSVNLSPGATYEWVDPKLNLSLHAETAFEFAYDSEDYHISLGLHLGYDF